MERARAGLALDNPLGHNRLRQPAPVYDHDIRILLQQTAACMGGRNYDVLR